MYKDVVKAMFAKYKGQMPAKDIMKMAAAEYRKMGGRVGASQMPAKRDKKVKKEKGGAFDMTSLMSGLFGMGLDDAPAAGAMSAGDMPAGAGIRRRGRGRKPKMARGGSIFSDIGDLFGLGLDAPAAGAMSAGDMPAGAGMRRRGRKAKTARGAGIFGDILHPIADIGDSVSGLLGMGLDDAPAAGAMSAGGMRRRGRKAKVARGAGIFGDILHPIADIGDSVSGLLGLGLDKKKGRGRGRRRGGYLSAGGLSAGELGQQFIPDGAFGMTPIQPRMFDDFGSGSGAGVSGGNILDSVSRVVGHASKFLPLMALI